MKLNELLTALAERAIQLRRDGDALIILGQKGPVNPLLVSGLREHKSALLDLLDKNDGLWSPPPVITPEMVPLVRLNATDIERIVGAVPGGAANIQDIYPLAPLQEGILFHHLMTTEGDMYLSLTLLRFDTRARLDGYLQALQAVIDRHDILRTAVLWEGLPEPVQVVWRKAPLAMEEVNLDPSAGDVAQQLRARFDPRRYRLDVRHAPLMRVFIVRDTAGGRWVLLWLNHHLSTDHTTKDLILQEIRAHLLGQAERLPAPLPFRNFVAQTRLGVSNEEHEAFFRTMLGDVDQPTAPFGLTNVQDGGARVEEARREVDAPLAKRLRECTRALGVSAASLCHLAFAQVLARVSGCEDVVFGTLLLGRMQGGEGADRALGMFINTLPVRIRIGDDSVRESVRRTHMLITQLLRHEHAPLALAQRCSAVAPPAPLFSALLNYVHNQTAPQATTEVSQAWEGMEVLDSEDNRSNYPFALTVGDMGDGFSLIAKVQAPIDPRRICGFMHTALEQLAGALERAPATPVRSLDVLSAPERRQLLVEWNATRCDYPKHQCIHELIEAQAARMPAAIAVVHEQSQLRYGELNQQANRLAHHLRKLGVKPDARVAICVEKSLDMVVGLLAILKAGGAYVPLDPAYPAERLAYMVADSAPVALLTHADVAPQVQANLRLALAGSAANVPIIDLETDATRWARQPATDPDRVGGGLTPEHLAYVIYTSGSTGRPKGVMVAHRGLCNLSVAQMRGFTIEPDSRVLQFASFSFDACIFEIVMALCQGASLYLAAPGTVLAGQTLADVIERHRITHATLPPAVLAGLPEHAKLDSIRTLIVAGDAVSGALVKRWAPGRHFINAYGPTEATVWATLHACSADAEGSPPIGRPIANARIYLLDKHGAPVPIGVTGEMYIGGAGIARGYLNRLELTAERFVTDPFAGEPDARMYKSGDLARYRADGSIEFLGRNDFQVKLRGFRVELDEIEARLAEYPALRGAVVLMREDSPGDKRLVAYYTVAPAQAAPAAQPAAAAEVNAEALRAHLSALLPDYLVPAAYVMLDTLPLTPNGKLDRNALPAPEASSHAAREYAAPVGEIETALAQIWADVLKLERVGRHDHFFNLGGHSLLAIKVASQLRRILGVEVGITELFANPVLTELAGIVNNAARSTLPPITVAERDRPLPLSFAQQRLWFLSQMEGMDQAYNIPLGLRLTGQLDRPALRRALDRLVARHEALRTTFTEIDGQPLQRIGPEDSGFTLQECTLRQHPGIAAELERLAAEAAAVTFDLESGPLIRGQLIELEPAEHVLLVTMHHIISDGWSMGILTNELGALYTAYRDGQADPLPPLAIQYADYAAWQRRWLTGDALQAQAEYWRGTLAGAPALLELPTDRPRPAAQDHSGSSTGFELDEQLTSGLKTLSRRHGTTLFMTLLTAWATLFARLSGQNEVVIGTPIANRTRTEIEPIIGFFVNTLALKIDLSGSPTVSELLQRVKAHTLAAQQHQDLPFEQVVEIVKPPRSLAHSPVFQVMFSLQNHQTGKLDLPGLRLASVGTPYKFAKFDLSIDLSDAGEDIFGGVTYATALFDHSTVERHLGYLRTVLAAMAADDRQVADRLPLLSPAERRQLLVEWNATQADYPSGNCIHALVEAQAAAYPDAVAVVHEERQWRYRELNEQANRLAHYLRTLGVAPGARVAILLERSLELVLAELAVLKCGAAYVPLDRNAPAERHAFMIEDCGASIALTARHFALPESAGVTHIDIDALDLTQQASHDPALSLDSETPACIMYTSGSTGQPKGVVLPHRAIGRLVLNNGYALFEAADRFAFAANPAFDVTLMEVWAPLVHGGRIVVVPQAVVLDPNAFAELLRKEQVSVLLLVAGLLSSYADQVAHIFPQLRYLLTGGDVGDPRAIAKVLRHNPPQHLVHCYGPTETTLFATACELTHVAEGANGISIGRPISNTQIYLLDRHGQPVPVGVTAEIHIGGAGVALGYLNRPELTAERFVDDPFAGNNARMYKTGDLARYLVDGSIEFLGRNDFQVKMRGFRVELGEIEARLAQHPAIHDAVVLMREDNPGNKRLVAYYTVAEEVQEASVEKVNFDWSRLVGHALGQQTSGDNDTVRRAAQAEQLRAHLAALLPEYMVPAAYVALDALPLTANGKLDRRMLPIPDQTAIATRTYEAPQGPVEIAIARIWRDLLGVAQVGRHDHFFELGGHSLLGVQLISRLRHLPGVEVALRDLFAYPNLEALAAAIDTRRTGTLSRNLAAIRPGGSLRPLFLIHPGYGEIGYARDMAPWLDPDLPVYGVAARGFLQDETPLRTVEEMAKLYIQAMRQVQPHGPYRVAGWSFGGIAAYEIANQLIGADETVEFLGLIETYATAYTPGAADMDEAAYLLALGADRAPLILDELKTLAAAGDIDAMLARSQAAGLIAEDLDPQTVRRHLGVYHGISVAGSSYTPPPIPVRLSLLTCTEEKDRVHPGLGWELMTGADLHITPVGGDHATIMQRPHIERLGSVISGMLAEASEQAPVHPEHRHAPGILIQSGRPGVRPLFCVPGAGAGVPVFSSLTRALGRDLPVHGMQPRGLDGILVPHIDVPSAARAYIRAIREIQPGGPYRLLGHSFGGWVAFEMARQLLAAGEEIASLVILDSRPPAATAEGNKRHTRVAMLLKLTTLFESAANRSLELTAADFVPLDHDEQLALLLERLIAAKRMSAKTNLQTLRGIMRVFETNMNTHYQPEGIYQGALHLVGAADTAAASNTDSANEPDRITLWRRHAPQAVYWECPGNHMTLLAPPHVEVLADRLRPLLEK